MTQRNLPADQLTNQPIDYFGFKYPIRLITPPFMFDKPLDVIAAAKWPKARQCRRAFGAHRLFRPETPNVMRIDYIQLSTRCGSRIWRWWDSVVISVVCWNEWAIEIAGCGQQIYKIFKRHQFIYLYTSKDS